MIKKVASCHKIIERNSSTKRSAKITMNITIYDVAREASVSMATVSRVVNGNPNVKPTTRKRY